MKAVITTMPNNRWRILEYVKVAMRSFTINPGPENYNRTLPVKPKTATEKELRTPDLIPRPTMPKKMSEKVTLILAIPIMKPPAPPP